MAQWGYLLKLDPVSQNRVRQVYEGRFPIEIRHRLAQWLEGQNWDSAASDDITARGCFQALLQHLDEECNRSVQENCILQGPDFYRMKTFIVERFQDEPVNLALLLSGCLKEERSILASASSAQVQPQWTELDHTLSQLKGQLLQLKKEIKTLEGLNEKLDFIQKAWQSKLEQKNGLLQSQALVEKECLKRAGIITQTKQSVLQELVALLNLASQTVSTLTEVELPGWRRRQQLACIGSPEDTSLEPLQKWFTSLAEVLFGAHEEVQKLQEQNSKFSSADASSLSESLAEIQKFCASLIGKLLTKALVVEKQPVMQKSCERPLVLKTGVFFNMTVRFLANLPAFKCLLKVRLVFDKDVEDVMAVRGFRLFDLVRDDCKVMDVDLPDNGLKAEFKNISLKDKKSRPRGSCESSLCVTEELHVIRFVTDLQYAGVKLHIEASSLPVVVVSNSNQVPAAWASIMWSNMLPASEPVNLFMFSNPPPLTWEQLSQLLTWQFLSAGNRGLNNDQLEMLRDKFVDDPNGLMHWTKFSKDESLWIWIDGILDLIRRFVSELWKDGTIMGFVSKQRTSSLLQEKVNGTFLIRFSESIKDGAITFSWVEHSNGGAHVHSVQPYTKAELKVSSLAEVIYKYTVNNQNNNYNPLIYLYPNIPKDTAFSRYLKDIAEPPVQINMREYLRRGMYFVSQHPTPPPSPPMEEMNLDNFELEDLLEIIEHHVIMQSDEPLNE